MKQFAKTHEWADIDENGIATIGISNYAQDALGDIVYVQLPEVGDSFLVGDGFAEVESVKAVSQIYCPVAGEVVEVNADVADNAALVNENCYAAWLVKIKVESVSGELLSEAEYDALDKE